MGSGLALDGESKTWELLERGVLGEAQSGGSTIGFELSSYMLSNDADGLTASCWSPMGIMPKLRECLGT